MSKPACAKCRFFHEKVFRPARESMGECRRYPKVRTIARTYSCGEFKR